MKISFLTFGKIVKIYCGTMGVSELSI